MSFIQEIASAHHAAALYALWLLAGALPNALLAQFRRRGFGRRGFGPRGPRLVFRVLRALLFASFLGPLLILAVIALLAYAFLSGRRR